MAERKHLFGSSDKTDFIVNLSDEGTKKLCAMYCIVSMILIELVALPYYLTKNVVDYVDNVLGAEVKHYLSEKVIYWVIVLMLGFGLLGLSVLLIGRMKKQVSFADNKALVIMGCIIVMSFISAMCSYDVNTAMTGYQDRAEGFMTLIGYYGFFAAAFTVVGDGWRKRLCAVMISVGTLNAVVGILQVIPALDDIIPNWFSKLNVNTAIALDLPAANGLAMTPHALAALLTVCFAAALAAVMFSEKLSSRLLSGAAAAVMTVAAVFTRTATALIGIGTAAFVMLAIGIAYAAKSKKPSDGGQEPVSAKKVIISLCCALVAAGASVGVLAATDNLQLHDEEVIYTDALRMIMLLDKDDSETWIYPYLWDDGLYIAEQNPIVGTGPDNYTTIYRAGSSIDRTYNEYIDTAMQRGFITMGLYILFVLLTLVKAIKAVAAFIRGEVGWAAAAVCGGLFAYSVQAFFNISALTSTPFFFICAGLAWSYTARKKRKTEKEEN